MSTVPTDEEMSRLWTYLSEEQQQTMNRDAFNDIARVYMDFLRAHHTVAPAHWVCDAVPGHGKTTVFGCVLKMLAVEQAKSPLLLVFNNKDTMMDFYRDVRAFADVYQIADAIQYVDADTVELHEPTLSRYRNICITQQRFRDLALGFGQWLLYGQYQPAVGIVGFSQRNETESLQRAIVVDEMPIMFDECIFDIGTTNNSAEWFDVIARSAMLDDSTTRMCRSTIMALISFQLLLNETTVTAPLKKYFDGSPLWDAFYDVYAPIERRRFEVSSTVSRYQHWFSRLLHEDAVGCIDRHKSGAVILCSRKIRYEDLGNVLILDGTSRETPTIYMGYTMKEVENRHLYSKRLRIHWRKLNTSKESRSNKNTGVFEAIATDVQSIRKRGGDPFPLVPKADIPTFKENGVIAKKYHRFYQGRGISAGDSEEDDDRLALNIFNTTGKNDLRSYNALALTALPIRHPQYYKLKAIGVFGTSTDISMASKKDAGWFKNPYVEILFLELVHAELLQIIHRTSLRNLNSTEPVDIYMFHNQKGWNEWLKNSLDLKKSNFTETSVTNPKKHGFEENCLEWVDVTRKFFNDPDRVDQFGSETWYTVKDIGGTRFRNWLNNHWKDKETVIKAIFESHGFALEQARGGNKERRVSRIE